jgi:hypothetical protein
MIETVISAIMIIDIRKDAYPQIAKFYKMYFEDKK